MKININLSGLLLIVFIILKLTGVINWTWLWVLSPVWIPFLFFGGVMAFAFILGLLSLALK